MFQLDHNNHVVLSLRDAYRACLDLDELCTNEKGLVFLLSNFNADYFTVGANGFGLDKLQRLVEMCGFVTAYLKHFNIEPTTSVSQCVSHDAANNVARLLSICEDYVTNRANFQMSFTYQFEPLLQAYYCWQIFDKCEISLTPKMLEQFSDIENMSLFQMSSKLVSIRRLKPEREKLFLHTQNGLIARYVWGKITEHFRPAGPVTIKL